MVQGDHSPTHSRWSVEAGDPDGETEVLVLRDSGRLTFPLFIVNENFISITIEFEYTVPFEATVSGPESLTIEGSSSEEFNVMLSGIDPFEHTAGTTGEFEVVGTVTSRQGLPVSVPGDSDSSTIDIEIPAIHSLSLELKGPLDPIVAGQSSQLEVTLTNSGNVAERASQVTVSGNCPFITYGENVEQLTGQTIASGASLSAEIPFEVPVDHSTKVCNFAVDSFFVWGDGSLSSSDGIRVDIVAVEVDEESTGSTVSNTLPGPGILSGIFAILLAAVGRRCE
tara:strand:- start:20777 stop:21622 length:846 start_codon:yes stop_codon:yes gene_type:complete